MLLDKLKKEYRFIIQEDKTYAMIGIPAVAVEDSVQAVAVATITVSLYVAAVVAASTLTVAGG